MIKQFALLVLAGLAMAAFGDQTYSDNKKANRLYEKGKYDEALKIYDDAILEAPADQKLKMNKGSTLYRLNQFDKAEEAYNSAQDVKDKKALADLYFNRGNILYREGQQQMQQGGQGAQDKLKAALDNYIKTLDLRSSDRDAKWNLQLTQAMLKKAQQQQQQNQDKNKQNKQDQNKQDQKNNQQNQNQKQDNKDQQNKQDQDQKKQQDHNDQQKQNQDQQDKKDQQKQPQPQQPDKQEQMKKEEAERLIREFSDDANNLNKPVKVYKAIEKKPDKDW